MNTTPSAPQPTHWHWVEQANAVAQLAEALATGSVNGPTYAAVLKLQGQVSTLLAWTADDRAHPLD